MTSPKWQRTFAIWCVVLCAVLLALYRFSPPKELALDAPSTEFSSARARAHLRIFAEQPHAIGTATHARVRDYLFAELIKLGLAPEIQKTSIATEFFGSIHGADVENILARIPGRSSTKSVALVAHYDSVPASRGASDDGAGVVTLLETARALLSMDNLDNDVILLFTDGEENGLLGARAFVTLHPWAQDVGIFFNFEARGHEGASTMFRTSPHNGKLIPGFAESVTRPITNSLVSTLARFLPNDTDFTVLTSAEQYWPRTELVFAKTQTMPIFFSRGMPVWQGTAPHNIYPAPHLEVLLDEVDTVHNLRTLKLKISLRRKADCIVVWEESPSIVRDISVNGRKVVRSEARFSKAVDKLVIDAILGQPLRYWEVRYCNIPESGLIIDAKRDITSTAMRLRVVDDAHETFLPFSNRAANTMPTPWGDRSMVSKLFTL